MSEFSLVCCQDEPIYFSRVVGDSEARNAYCAAPYPGIWARNEFAPFLPVFPAGPCSGPVMMFRASNDKGISRRVGHEAT